MCRRRGEAEIEKGPVDLFPAEPTEEHACVFRDRTLGFTERFCAT